MADRAEFFTVGSPIPPVVARDETVVAGYRGVFHKRLRRSETVDASVTAQEVGDHWEADVTVSSRRGRRTTDLGTHPISDLEVTARRRSHRHGRQTLVPTGAETVGAITTASAGVAAAAADRPGVALFITVLAGAATVAADMRRRHHASLSRTYERVSRLARVVREKVKIVTNDGHVNVKRKVV